MTNYKYYFYFLLNHYIVFCSNDYLINLNECNKYKFYNIIFLNFFNT